MASARATDVCVVQYLTCTAQVDGSTKILVTVVATQELEAGDVLRRFKAEVPQNKRRRGR